MKAASAKEALNLNNSEYFVTPYTLGLVLKSSNSGGGYRIGDVIISVNEENPSVKYGGKWELLCPGRTLVCIDTSQTEFNTIRQTGGENEHTLTIDEMPSHSHTYTGFAHNITTTDQVAGAGIISTQNPYIDNTSSTGGGQAHNNLQPYMVVYMWVRVS